MRISRVWFTVRRMLVAVGVCAIVTYAVSERLKGRIRDSYGRRLEIADNHARSAREYRRNAGGDPGMLRLAAWHEHMRRVFEDAAARYGTPLPASSPFPPKGWRGPEKGPVTSR